MIYNKASLFLSMFGIDEAELRRLAVIGMWAEKHGVPAMKDTEARADDYADSWISKPIREALAALPKVKE